MDRYPSFISYHDKYYYRSGSTMRTITRKALDKTLLKSQGRIWDGMSIAKLQVTDLRREAIGLFKEKALRRHGLTEEETRVDDTILMENLHLFDEDGYLIRAVMLAFYKDPEKWVTGSYIKVGRDKIGYYRDRNLLLYRSYVRKNNTKNTPKTTKKEFK